VPPMSVATQPGQVAWAQGCAPSCQSWEGLSEVFYLPNVFGPAGFSNGQQSPVR
jgi:hypothetical protein